MKKMCRKSKSNERNKRKCEEIVKIAREKER